MQSVTCVPDDLTVRPIEAPARCRPSRVALLVVALLTFISEVARVQADLWVVAVVVVQPYLMMDCLAQLLATLLADTSVNCHPCFYISGPGSTPCLAFIELRLGHSGLHRKKPRFRPGPLCYYSINYLLPRTASFSNFSAQVEQVGGTERVFLYNPYITHIHIYYIVFIDGLI